MKRLMCILLCILALVGLTLPALAEAVVPAPAAGLPPLVDWTKVLTDIIVGLTGVLASAVLGLIGYYGKKYAGPWIKENRLTDLVKELVRAAEARFGRQQGERKLRQVMAWLRERGIKVDDERVVQAVLAAWQDLDLEMIAIGVKDPEEAKQPPDGE